MARTSRRHIVYLGRFLRVGPDSANSKVITSTYRPRAEKSDVAGTSHNFNEMNESASERRQSGVGV